ncbi:MAG TPA: peptidase M61, partial [Rhodanobacteraceae bacterium]|nr:peptidase M61 [Rhodanobacteraceae bacterium]
MVRMHRPLPLSVRLFALCIFGLAGLAFAGAAAADAADAQIPAPQDTPYPGTIAIHVDASDTSQGIFRVHETIPVTPGKLILLYPK